MEWFAKCLSDELEIARKDDNAVLAMLDGASAIPVDDARWSQRHTSGCHLYSTSGPPRLVRRPVDAGLAATWSTAAAGMQITAVADAVMHAAMSVDHVEGTVISASPLGQPQMRRPPTCGGMPVIQCGWITWPKWINHIPIRAKASSHRLRSLRYL